MASGCRRGREASDYSAETFELSEAQEIVATAERFVAAVERVAP